MGKLFYMYILRCSDGSYYVGSTDNLQERIAAHNAGRGPSYTSKRRPVRLVYSKRYDNKSAAVRRERQVKGWTRAKKEALILGNLDELKRLSKRRS